MADILSMSVDLSPKFDFLFERSYALAAWAKTGAEKHEELALDFLPELIEVLFRDGDGIPSIDDSRIGVVINAALARRQLAQGEGVPVPWLAALAGVDRSTIRRKILIGVLHRDRSEGWRGHASYAPVDAESAKRMLAAQNVPGF